MGDAGAAFGRLTWQCWGFLRRALAFPSCGLNALDFVQSGKFDHRALHWRQGRESLRADRLERPRGGRLIGADEFAD